MKKFHSGPPWYSSYEENNYGDFFYSLIRIYKPEKIVELGTKAGYSAYHMARGLKANGRGTLDCYDLWQKYKFHSVPISVAQKNLKDFKRIITLNLCDAVDAEKNYDFIDILHVDLSNDGFLLEKIVPKWLAKIRQMIIIEGGSAERDNIEWMKIYKKKPIKKWLEELCRKNDGIECITFEPFPSVSIIRKI